MQPESLLPRALETIRSRDHHIFLSVVSPWEMQIKFSLKKPELRVPPVALVQTELDNGAFALLPITLGHIHAMTGLPDHHRDQFDRLLIAQALHENLTILTSDEKIARYPVPTLW